MKRVLILAIVMVLMFCSCDFAKKTTDDLEKGGNINSNISNSTNKVSNEEKKDKALEDLGKLVDLSKYEEPSETDDGFFVRLINEEMCDLDNTIILSDNTKINLPISYEEIKNAGWSANEGIESQQIEAITPNENAVIYAETGTISLFNSKHEQITVDVANTTTKPKFVKDCDIYSVRALLDNGDAPFALTNGITEKSTPADMIDVMGNPYEITYKITEEKEILCFLYENGNGYEFDEFNAEFLLGGEMIKMTYRAGYETAYKD